MTATTLILGDGPVVRRMAAALVEHGRPVAVACPQGADAFLSEMAGPLCELYEKMRLAAVAGAVGNFQVTLAGDGRQVVVTAGDIVLAEADRREAQFSAYGLTAGETVWGLGRLDAALTAGNLPAAVTAGAAVVFLHGLSCESHPVVTRTVMAAAETLCRDHGLQVFVLTGNLKVGSQGLEQRYRRCRQSGVVFVKFTGRGPDIDFANSRVRLVFDDAVTGQRCRLDPALTVVDEWVRPSPETRQAAALLGLETDTAGFAQADNVRRFPVATNRAGVWVVGPARTVQGPQDQCTDTAAALHTLTATAGPPPLAVAEIRRAGCARCLTCVRSCPHQAIRLDDRPEVMPAACQGCGICAASCPAATITFRDERGTDLATAIADALRRCEPQPGRPLIVALCCSRSAGVAARSAAARGASAVARLRIVEVPCGGSVASDHLLALMERGVDGVLVLTCHAGNCQAGPGPEHARVRTASTAAILGSLNQGGRLQHAALAANMGESFNDIVSDFAAQLG